MAAAMTATVTAVIIHPLTRFLELWGHCFQVVAVAVTNETNESSIILIIIFMLYMLASRGFM